MRNRKQLQMGISPEAREGLSNWMVSSGIAQPIPGAVLVQKEDGAPLEWLIGMYDKQAITTEFETSVVVIDSMEFFVPQGQFAEEKLEGKSLAIVDSKYVIV